MVLRADSSQSNPLSVACFMGTPLPLVAKTAKTSVPEAAAGWDNGNVT